MTDLIINKIIKNIRNNLRKEDLLTNSLNLLLSLEYKYQKIPNANQNEKRQTYLIIDENIVN